MRRVTGYVPIEQKADRDQEKNLAASEPEQLKKLTAMLVKKYREVQAEGPEWKFGK